jgi:Flp pilus assembly pilin Flp
LHQDKVAPLTVRIPNPTKLNAVRRALARFYREEDGQDLIEYVLIFTVVGLGAISGVHGVAAQVSGYFNTIKQAVANDIGTL